MPDDAPTKACCGACEHAIAVEAAGAPPPSTAPLLYVPLDEEGRPRGVRLEVTSGKLAGGVIDLEKASVVVGRTAAADVTLPDDVISRKQCRFFVRDDHLYLEDLGSSCGTWVDAQKIRRVALRHGQRILIGNHIFTVKQTELG